MSGMVAGVVMNGMMTGVRLDGTKVVNKRLTIPQAHFHLTFGCQCQPVSEEVLNG